MRRLLPCLVGLLALLAVAVPAAGKTVVSLTFDDSTADQYQVAPLLAAPACARPSTSSPGRWATART